MALLRGCGRLLLKSSLDLDELGPMEVQAGDCVEGNRTRGRTSSFFFSDLSPRSFSCPSTRLLCSHPRYNDADYDRKTTGRTSHHG